MTILSRGFLRLIRGHQLTGSDAAKAEIFGLGHRRINIVSEDLSLACIGLCMCVSICVFVLTLRRVRNPKVSRFRRPHFLWIPSKLRLCFFPAPFRMYCFSVLRHPQLQAKRTFVHFLLSLPDRWGQIFFPSADKEGQVEACFGRGTCSAEKPRRFELLLLYCFLLSLCLDGVAFSIPCFCSSFSFH